MLLNLWNSSGRSDKAMSDKASHALVNPPRSPIPFLNKTKRQRDESSPLSPQVPNPQFKQWAETMSHVEVPACTTHKFSLSTSPKVPSGGLPVGISASMDGGPPTKLQRTEKDKDVTTSKTSQASSSNKRDNQSREIRQTRPSKPMTDIAAIRRTVESHFGLEILLKHRELRLINQEFGKCQAALEQLRRCETMPYPATSSSTDDVIHVVDGSGPVFNNNAPKAPPWGVVNGPYSRHYERWLLQDSAFDDSFVEDPVPSSAGKTLPERSTRGSKSEKTSVASSSRAQRGSNARLKSLPHGYPEVKEEKGPMIVKRSSDGKMVKLVCLDCRRSNFNSAQGFINHCRIAHGRSFLSHDAAIEASGEEMDAETEGATEASSGGRAPANAAGLVHPLIRAIHLVPRTPIQPVNTSTASTLTPSASSSKKEKTTNGNAILSHADSPKPARTNQPIPRKTPHPSFTASPATPHLSALLERTGNAADLKALVDDATTKPEIDLSQMSDDEDDEEAEEVAEEPQPQSRSTRGVLRGGHLPPSVNTLDAATRQSDFGTDGSADTPDKLEFPMAAERQHPYPSPFSIGHQDSSQHSLLDIRTPFNLSPNTTDPHPAPSLVSDDGDHETMHTDSDGQSSAGEDEPHHFLDTELLNHEEMDLEDSSRLDLHDTNTKRQTPSHSRPTPHGPVTSRKPRAPKALHESPSIELGNGQRHVSFVSPTRNQKKGVSKNGAK